MRRLLTNIETKYRFPKIITACLVILFCFCSLSCSQKYIPPDFSVLPLEETYHKAESVALDWQADAQLHAVDFDIQLSSSPDRMYCAYTFLSASNHRFLMVFVTKIDSGYKLESVEDPWPADRPIGTPILFNEITLESYDALNAIMKSGGGTFFERYQIESQVSLDHFSLSLERLDEYNGEGILTWASGFSIDNPQHAQLYMTIEDGTGDLLKVKAFGEKEQEYWFRELTVTERILLSESKNFFDLFDLRLDKITEENGRRYADVTIISPKTPWLLRGELTHTHSRKNSVFPFDPYEITLVRIDQEAIEVEVMPIERWYKPRPID